MADSLDYYAILIVGLNVFAKDYLASKESMILQLYAEKMAIILSYSIGAWFINQGLKIFLWEEIYIRLTGMSAPAVIRGAVSVAIYTVTALIILVVVLDLNPSAVLLSTGLVAAVLGVAMQNTITDFFFGYYPGNRQIIPYW